METKGNDSYTPVFRASRDWERSQFETLVIENLPARVIEQRYFCKGHNPVS